MSDASTNSNTVVRRAFLKINPETTLQAVDTLDLRAHAKVSAVVGVPLRQLQQRRDVQAFATTAPMAALKALLEVLAAEPLGKVVAYLGDHADSPTYEQLSSALDQLLASGSSDDDAVVVLAFAIGESFPAAPHCAELFENREALSLPELPELAVPSVLASPREVSPEIREQRKARREEEKRRKKSSSSTRPSRAPKHSNAPPTRLESRAKPAQEASTPTHEQRRRVLFTPLELARFDVEHSLVGAIILAEVPFDAQDPEQPEVSAKERPALVVGASNDELLVRPIYSQSATTRSIFQPWRRLGLDHVSYIDDARVAVKIAGPPHQLGHVTVEEWNALS